jgi:DNA-binding NarL/FixJ family response regulator
MNVLIADDQSNVRYGLRVLFEELREIDVVAEAVNCRQLLKLIQSDCTDLILLSWDLPGQNSRTLIRSVKLICPHTHIIVMSSKIRSAETAIGLGADAFISKTKPPEQLIEIIRTYIS